jgi:hypothetical protein
MTELSAVAYAVYNAVLEISPAPADEIAATALRAAANDWRVDTEYIDGVEYIRTSTLERIADELEGVKYGTYRCNLEEK